MSPQDRRLPIEDAAGAGFVYDTLIELASAQVRRLLRQLHLRRDLRRCIDPRHAIAWCQCLRKAAQVDDAARAIVGAQRPNVRLGCRVFEVQVAIGIVFHQEHVAALRPFEQRHPLLEADEQARRVLKVRHEVEQPRASPRPSQPLAGVVELAEVDAISALTHANHVGLHVAESRDGAGIGRELDQDHVMRIEQHTSHEVESLLRAGRDKQSVVCRFGAAARHDPGDGIEQRPEAARRTVLQYRSVPAGEELLGDRLKILPREGVGRRKSRRERHDVAALRHDAAHLPDGRRFHVTRRAGEKRVVVDHAGRLSGTAVSEPLFR